MPESPSPTLYIDNLISRCDAVLSQAVGSEEAVSLVREVCYGSFCQERSWFWTGLAFFIKSTYGEQDALADLKLIRGKLMSIRSDILARGAARSVRADYENDEEEGVQNTMGFDSSDTSARTPDDSLSEVKCHKLFVSHSSKDKECVEALVELLEGIGMPEGTIVCTSVPGYGIPGGAKVFDWLRDQFLTCDLRVMFVLSRHYYDSAPCLNEMGAAWVTKASHTLLLLPGFGFSDIEGCIDSSEIGISFDSDLDELNHRLNELKDTLVEEYDLPSVLQSKWERYRNRFVDAVKC